jgi:hypothetical protein
MLVVSWGGRRKAALVARPQAQMLVPKRWETSHAALGSSENTRETDCISHSPHMAA